MLEDGPRVAVAWCWKGTHLGEMPGILASGKPIIMTGLTVYDFDGVFPSGHWQVTDKPGIHQQLSADDQNRDN